MHPKYSKSNSSILGRSTVIFSTAALLFEVTIISNLLTNSSFNSSPLNTSQFKFKIFWTLFIIIFAITSLSKVVFPVPGGPLTENIFPSSL